ncbi:glycosyl hydrolase [Actinoplanes sp. NPDC051411]|uniref:glycosyl hydrolase n=1 Tax=Actinoplanes sp. NPDC051411 TaxID=3155522 RepID=UPI0034397B19
MIATAAFACSALVVASSASAEPSTRQGPQQTDAVTTIAGGLSATQFKNPGTSYKPAIRWWWQAPLTNDEALREMQAITDAGFSEVEIAFSSGAWATDDQRTVLGNVLDKASTLGIKVSMTMGPAWPIKTPNTGAGSGFASQELQYGLVHLSAGQHYSGPVPAPIDAAKQKQPTTLVEVTASRVVQAGPDVTMPGTPPTSSTVLDRNSLIELTGQVTNGQITWTAPATGNWELFGLWSRDNSAEYTSEFDASAAQQATKDLDQIQIGPDNAPKLTRSGQDLFEDSLELHATSIYWTPQIQQEFKAAHGYDMAKYLPLLFVQGESDFPVPPKQPVPDFTLSDRSADKIRHDYYETLTDLYVRDHLQPLQQWAAKYGMQYKAQASYGQDLEPVRSFRSLQQLGGRSETESLDGGENLPISTDDPSWANSLAFQQTIASGVHQGGGTLLSTELGAIFKPAYSMNLSDYQDLMAKEWAAGVSQPFIHGFALQAPNAAWPGTTRFGETVTESWNDATFPQWSSWPTLTSYFARGTRVLETGTAKTDVAVYSDAFLSARGNQTPFDEQRLQKAGYSVEYLDPVGLADQSHPRNGELFPTTSGYRALVIDQRAISHQAAAAILQAAKAGVRVVFVGALPDQDTTYATGVSGDNQVKTDIAATLRQHSATNVAAQSDVAAALTDLGLTPRVASHNTQLLTQWRQVDGGDYIDLYNPSDKPVTFDPSFDVQGVPSQMNLWDGSTSPIAQYTTGKGRTSIPMTLQGKETRIIAINKKATPGLHVVGDTPPEGGRLTVSGDRIEFLATTSGAQNLKLSNGKTVRIEPLVDNDKDIPLSGPPSSRPSLIDPWSPWSLTVQTATPTGSSTVSVPNGLGDSQFQQFNFKDWRDITTLHGESGVGTYTATTTLPDGWTPDAAHGMLLNLGTVDGTAKVTVNGTVAGSQVTDGQQWDITRLLHAGKNTVNVEVRTTLRNAVSTYNKKAVASQPYGLRGPVTLQPTATTTVYESRH